MNRNFNLKLTALLFFYFFFFQTTLSFGQSFDIEQVEQIWRPRLKLESKYLGPSAFSDTIGNYFSGEFNTSLTFPIKSKFGADLKLDLSSLKLKDIIKNSVRLRAYQVLGNAKFGMRQANLGFDSLSNKRNLIYGQAGIMGLWLTPKYRIGFYSANVYIAEDQNTLNTAAVRVNGMIGQYHLKGLRKNYYYGVYLSYSDGLVIPVPFLGGKVPVGDNVTFNYLLPAQIYFNYSPESDINLCLGATLDGYRNGVKIYNKRLNMNYGSANVFLNYRQKLNKVFAFKLEAGYCVKQYIKINDSGNYRSDYPISQGFYGQVTITTLFGRSLFEKVMDAIAEKRL